MSQGELDPVIHAPTRLRIVATLSTLPAGTSLSFTRLQNLLDLTPGNLITHLRKLDEAGYVTTEKARADTGSRTSVHLTHTGRAAFDNYTTALRRLLEPAPPEPTAD